jgi:fructuronate reductase
VTARLALATLDRLPSRAVRPGYDIARQKIGIVHLGIGAFHRAHQAVYVDDRLAAGEPDWAILGASLRSPDTRDALAPQDGLYTVLARANGNITSRVIGSVRQLLVAPENPAGLLEAMSNPRVRIVSLTVTEKGYCHDPATGELLEDHPDIIHDLASPLTPKSAAGFLVEALRRRREDGIQPFTVLCCDNLPRNGETARRVISRFAELRDPGLGRHLANEVAFPSTMVDRIVPATTDADRTFIAEALGVEDQWPVATEPFSQWVIEDNFPGGRPHFEESGAELVGDVAPYETMKLRLLNGAHSTLAYLGYLAGHETISEAMAAPAFARLARELMDEEVTPTLGVPPGADLPGYKNQLLARFANTALRHRTWQIAMDGSQKLPQRLLGTARDRLKANAPLPRIALGIAGWMRYVTGKDENGQAIDVRDPLADRLRRLADAAGPYASRLAPALLGVREIFGDDLPRDPRFAAAVESALAVLLAKGAAYAVESCVKS